MRQRHSNSSLKKQKVQLAIDSAKLIFSNLEYVAIFAEVGRLAETEIILT